MKFWDSSAVVPLVFREATSALLNDLLTEDSEMAVWWGTWTECAVTISRLRRVVGLGDEVEHDARVALDELASNWTGIKPADDTRLLASLLFKDHPLKTADALQLAAALRWRGAGTGDHAFVCLDERLRRSATAEGFAVLPETGAA